MVGYRHWILPEIKSETGEPSALFREFVPTPGTANTRNRIPGLRLSLFSDDEAFSALKELVPTGSASEHQPVPNRKFSFHSLIRMARDLAPAGPEHDPHQSLTGIEFNPSRSGLGSLTLTFPDRAGPNQLTQLYEVLMSHKIEQWIKAMSRADGGGGTELPSFFEYPLLVAAQPDTLKPGGSLTVFTALDFWPSAHAAELATIKRMIDSGADPTSMDAPPPPPSPEDAGPQFVVRPLHSILDAATTHKLALNWNVDRVWAGAPIAVPFSFVWDDPAVIERAHVMIQTARKRFESRPDAQTDK